jgi:hypothetical protein
MPYEILSKSSPIPCPCSFPVAMSMSVYCQFLFPFPCPFLFSCPFPCCFNLNMAYEYLWPTWQLYCQFARVLRGGAETSRASHMREDG